MIAKSSLSRVKSYSFLLHVNFVEQVLVVDDQSPLTGLKAIQELNFESNPGLCIELLGFEGPRVAFLGPVKKPTNVLFLEREISHLQLLLYCGHLIILN